MVRLAQDFSMRYPLVDGHGNFGSVDGDGAAAMRYTEARLSKLYACEMLARYRQGHGRFLCRTSTRRWHAADRAARRASRTCLVNGAGGIAVGMATNIPPHNLGEVDRRRSLR